MVILETITLSDPFLRCKEYQSKSDIYHAIVSMMVSAVVSAKVSSTFSSIFFFTYPTASSAFSSNFLPTPVTAEKRKTRAITNAWTVKGIIASGLVMDGHQE